MQHDELQKQFKKNKLPKKTPQHNPKRKKVSKMKRGCTNGFDTASFFLQNILMAKCFLCSII